MVDNILFTSYNAKLLSSEGTQNTFKIYYNFKIFKFQIFRNVTAVTTSIYCWFTNSNLQQQCYHLRDVFTIDFAI